MGEQPERRHVAVAIVGAGPSGLTAANLLGALGVETLLLERNAGLSSTPRAITIDDEGLRICQALGLREAMQSEMLLNIQARYLSRGYVLAHVAPRSQHNGFPLISTFHQPAFEAILLNGLARFPCVEVCFEHTVEALSQDEQGVQLTVRRAATNSQLLVACDYVLACDGGRSSLRQHLGIPMRPPGWFRPGRAGRRAVDHKQRWLVVDCSNDPDDSRCTIFFCNPARPAVTVPAPGQRRRWEFMLLPGEREEEVLHEETIYALIKQTRASQSLGALIDSVERPQIIRRTIYTFHTSLAERFAKGRVFLLGDAAHLMPPFGGQGMNSGLRDAHNLCWKLALVLRGQANPRLLASYQQERQPHAAQMIRFSALLGALIMPTSHLLARLRDLCFHGLNMLPLFRSLLSEARIKPQPRYQRGCLLPAYDRQSRRYVGRLLPQGMVRTLSGERLLLDDVSGPGFTLLRLYENSREAFERLEGEIWHSLGVRFVCLLPMGSSFVQNGWEENADVTVVIEEEPWLSRWLLNNRQIYVLLRPDRYVMGIGMVGQERDFEGMIERSGIFSEKALSTR